MSKQQTNSHPHSIDALCALPPSIPNIDTASTILTGSSDGFIRAVRVLPTKLLGVVADHGEWPVERIAIGSGVSGGEDIQVGENSDERKGKGKGGRVGKRKGIEEGENRDNIDEGKSERQERWWMGSAGHEEVLRMTDLTAFFVQQDDGGEGEQEGYLGVGGEESDEHELEELDKENSKAVEEDTDENNDSDAPKEKRKRKRKEKDPLAVKRKKGRNEVEADGTFFDEL
jgi:hypothetical protein